MKIISRVTGGLGNQMFQYAAAYALARRSGVDVDVDTSCYDYTHEAGRGYMLDRFAVECNVITPTRLSRFRYKLAAAERPELRQVAALARSALRLTDVQEREPYVYSPPQIPAGAGRVRLLGYWQSPKYFDDCDDDIRRQFTLCAAPTGRNAVLLEQIRACRGAAVSVHVRRGDYLRVRPHAVLSASYYERAAGLVAAREPSPTFFLFSDDLPWATAHLRLPGPIVPVDVNGPLTGEQDFRLMSACSHHVIANSSFSWWGAWLNPFLDKLVITPKYWMGTADTYYPDLLPLQWKSIDLH